MVHLSVTVAFYSDNTYYFPIMFFYSLLTTDAVYKDDLGSL